MKKIMAVIFMFAFIFAFTGCEDESVLSQLPSVPALGSETEEISAVDEKETNELQETEEMGEQTSALQNNTAVVYFSGTGNTRRIAERIADLTGSDLIEIIPAQLYTEEDLNYNDKTTRATVEQNTPEARPEIANEITLEGYTTVYLGYPIWWGQAPRILSTFVESHDFTGITVIPFCTSGSSSAGTTGETLGEQAGTGTFLTSTRFNKDISDSELQEWINMER